MNRRTILTILGTILATLAVVAAAILVWASRQNAALRANDAARAADARVERDAGPRDAGLR